MRRRVTTGLVDKAAAVPPTIGTVQRLPRASNTIRSVWLLGNRNSAGVGVQAPVAAAARMSVMAAQQAPSTMACSSLRRPGERLEISGTCEIRCDVDEALRKKPAKL